MPPKLGKSEFAFRLERAKRVMRSAMFTGDDVTNLELAARVQLKRRTDDDKRILTDRLTEIAYTFVHNRLWATEPSPTKTVQRLKAVYRAAKRLGAALPHEHRRPDSYFRSRLTAQAAVASSTPELTNLAEGSRRLRAATGAVKDIEVWSQVAILRESEKIQGRRWRRHRGDEAMQNLIGDLNGVWIDYWQRLPGASRSDATGKIGGPYIRFVQTFLECLKEHLTEDDFIADRGLKGALSATPQAIRERIQRTGISKIADGGKSGHQKI